MPIALLNTETRKALEAGGILPSSVVAWGHEISPSRQHLRDVSQEANHSRSWLPAGPNCPTPLQEPAFQDWVLHATQVQAAVGQIEAWRLEEHPTRSRAGWREEGVLTQSNYTPHIYLYAKTILLNSFCTSLLPTPLYPSFLPITGQTMYPLNSPISTNPTHVFTLSQSSPSSLC